MMRQRFLILTSAAMLTAPLLVGAGPPSNAGPPPTLNWGAQVHCDATGPAVIDVQRRVVDSLDSGFGSPTHWATIDYRQQLTVYETGENTFCVESRYRGQFDGGPAGFDSPGQDGAGNDTLEGDETGTFQGGFVRTLEGELRGDPAWPTRGFVGTQDHDCELPGGPSSCTDGAIDWRDKYFTSVEGLAFDWWGWIYRGGADGTWVNASTGSDGDID